MDTVLIRTGIADNEARFQARVQDLKYEWMAVFAVGGLIRAAAFNAWLDAGNYHYQQCVGSYKGETERCFIVPLNEVTDYGNAAIKPAFAGWIAGQESVLLLSPAYRGGKMYGSREAYVVPVSAGSFHPIPAADAYIGLYHFHGRQQPKLGDWTFNPTVPGFFTTKPSALADTLAADDATEQNAGNAALAAMTTHERLMADLSGPMGRKERSQSADLLPAVARHVELEPGEVALREMVENAEDE